jgi:hypothetical protein
VAFYLASHAGFRRTLLDERWSPRLLWGALAALATVPIGLTAPRSFSSPRWCSCSA